MELFVSFEEVIVIGSVLCAVVLALGVTFGHVDVVEGGAIIVSLCGGTVVAKALKTLRISKHIERE